MSDGDDGAGVLPGQAAKRDGLARAIGRMTLVAGDLESFLTLVIQGVVGPRAGYVTHGAPASVRLDWVVTLVAIPGVAQGTPPINVAAVVKRAKKLMEKRNSLVHATWEVREGDAFRGYARRRDGAFDETDHELAEIEIVTDGLQQVCRDLYSLVAWLHAQWGGQYAPR